MDPLYLRKLLINKQLRQETVQTHKTDRAESVNVNESTEINVAKQAENLVREMREEMLHPRRDLKMNYLASMERSSYVKKVMNLPKTLPELLMQLQNEDSIADDMPQMYYQQNKQKQENLKSDIREGVIRNAKESFEETLNKGVNNNQHSELDSESNKPTQPKPNVEIKPNTPQPPRHSEPTGEESHTPIQKPNVEIKPNTPQPPRHSEPTGEESQTPQQKPNVEIKPNMPDPPRHSELDSESNKPTQPKPNVENKPNTPQQKPNVNQEVKPDVPQTRPNVENKPNTPQPPRHSELDSESNKPTQQRPNVENKPNTPQPPRHSELDSESNKPTQQRPNVENKPNTPQPPRHSEANAEESQTPIQKPNVENKPNTPQPPRHSEANAEESQTPIQKPNVDNRPNMPEAPRHSELDSESNKPTQPKPNVENKPNIPQQRPNMPQPKPEIKPMYSADDMVKQYLENELWQPNRDHGARMADDIRPDMPPKPPMNRGERPEPMPMPKPPMNEGIRPQPPRPQPDTPRPPMEDNIRPNIPNRPPMHEEIKPDMPVRPNTPQPPHQEIPNKEPQRPAPPNQNVDNKPNIPQQRPNMPQPKPEIKPMYSADDMVKQYLENELWQPNRDHGARMADDIRPNMPPRPPMNEGIRPEPMPQPRPPMNEGIRPEPMPQPRPPMNEGIRPEPMPRPLPPHRPVMPPHHQHPEHVDIKPDLPGFKPDVGLQEYMRYEMLRPQPLPPPTNTSISSEVHRHHHHHKHLPPPPKEEISQETQAAMNVMQNVQQPAEPTITQMRQRLSGDAAELFFTGLINLNDLSNTLKTNSKGAKAKLVLAMANASKHGIDNSQINDTLKMISASMAATETSTPSKVLKNIIELYLPWYPLQQGVGFDLSIETKAGEQDFLSVLKVWIQTRNYGNVNAILTLMTSNSVDMSIQCSEKFPKDDLLKRLNEETKNRTMQSNINVEEFEQTEGYIEPQQQAKVSLSSTYEMNPYLLLMAHSFIKNTIVIDSNISFS